MSIVKHKIKSIRVCLISIALSIAFVSLSTSVQRLSAHARKASGTRHSTKRMADGKLWSTHNLDVNRMLSSSLRQR